MHLAVAARRAGEVVDWGCEWVWWSSETDVCR